MVLLASNAINVLILLSPFAIVDTTRYKGFRLLVLLTVPATALLIRGWVPCGR